MSAKREASESIDFYPRSPCGERRYLGAGQPGNVCHFYPRSPCGERRRVTQTCRAEISISIHALLAESDKRKGGTQQNDQ